MYLRYLFEIEKTLPFLVTCYLLCKDNIKLFRIRYFLQEFCSTIVSYFQITVIDAGFKQIFEFLEQKDQLYNVSTTFREVLGYVRKNILEINFNLAFGNVGGRLALENILITCNDFAKQVLLQETKNLFDIDESSVFHQIIGFINVLKLCKSPLAQELSEILDYNEFWKNYHS